MAPYFEGSQPHSFYSVNSKNNSQVKQTSHRVERIQRVQLFWLDMVFNRVFAAISLANGIHCSHEPYSVFASEKYC